MRIGQVASERTSRLTNLDPTSLGGGGKERKEREKGEKIKRKEGEVLERVCLPSL